MADSKTQDRKVRSTYHELPAKLAEHIAAITDGRHNTAAIIGHFEMIQNRITAIGNLLDTPVPTGSDEGAEKSTVAKQVLHIPELLELILGHCDSISLVNMRSSCRTFCDIIDASTKLQQRLFILPAGDLVELVHANAADDDHVTDLIRHHPKSKPDSWFWIFDDINDGLDLYIRFEPGANGGCRCRLPHVGSLWRKMLVCQPPVMKVTIVKKCRNHEFETICKEGNFSTGKPLTFGDLYDEASRIFGEDVMCDESICKHWVDLEYVDFECRVPFPEE